MKFNQHLIQKARKGEIAIMAYFSYTTTDTAGNIIIVTGNENSSACENIIIKP